MKIHALGDTLSRAPQLLINDLEVLRMDSEDMFDQYEEDDFYGPLLKVIDGHDNMILSGNL